MNAPVIALMQRAHIPGVIDIERTSFGMPWSRDAFLKVIENPAALAYVAVIESKVAGYFCALSLGEEAEVLKLAVAPSQRGKGVAKALNARCIEELRKRGCRAVHLEVRRSNREAIGLYEGFGFRTVGIRRGYYRTPPEDALMMKLVL